MVKRLMKLKGSFILSFIETPDDIAKHFRTEEPSTNNNKYFNQWTCRSLLQVVSCNLCEQM